MGIEPNSTLTTDTFRRSFLDFFTGFDRTAPAHRSSSSSFLHSRYIPAGSASCLAAEGLSVQHTYHAPFNTSTFSINIITMKLWIPAQIALTCVACIQDPAFMQDPAYIQSFTVTNLWHFLHLFHG